MNKQRRTIWHQVNSEELIYSLHYSPDAAQLRGSMNGVVEGAWQTDHDRKPKQRTISTFLDIVAPSVKPCCAELHFHYQF